MSNLPRETKRLHAAGLLALAEQAKRFMVVAFRLNPEPRVPRSRDCPEERRSAQLSFSAVSGAGLVPEKQLVWRRVSLADGSRCDARHAGLDGEA